MARKHVSSAGGPARIGKYEILAKIAQGGFGEVFLGRDDLLKRLVAIKTCTAPDDFYRRFLREVEIVGRLKHPNIITVYDAGFHDEVPFLVVEYLAGEDLADAIRQLRPSPPAGRLATLLQVARALEYAHARGVIHRDVKPSNIRVLGDGRVTLMDFGIAKLQGDGTHLTEPGATVGTLAYIAPEQLLGEAIDGRADIFSFGAVAYELLSYRRPFPGDTDPALLVQILRQEPTALAQLWPGCPPRLAALVARCLEKEPADRFPDCTSLIAELTAVAVELGPDTPRVDPIARILPPPLLSPELPQTRQQRPWA
ncbi:MAG: serine/threonine protein kinase [bacterium]|nr:serine/threonine protein kinase [bacterium]